MDDKLAVPDSVKKNVRAVLLSKYEGKGVLVSEFPKDYKHLLKENLNWKNLGFQNLQKFIEAMPDVVRLEFSENDMAYRMFGKADPNSYMSLSRKRATGEVKDEGGRRNRGRRGSPDNMDEDASPALKPNQKGLFTLCYPNRRAEELNTKEAILAEFSEAGEIGEINQIPSFTFVRYKYREDAEAALKRFAPIYGLKIADERKPKNKRQDEERERIREERDNIVHRGQSSQVNGETSSWGGWKGKAQDTDRGSFTSGEEWKSQVKDSAPSGGSGWRSLMQQKESAPSGDGYRSKSRGNREDDGLIVSPKSGGSGGSGNLIQVYVGNIPHEASEEDFKELVHCYCPSGTRVKTVASQPHKKYAFADFNRKEPAAQMVEDLDKYEWCGRTLQVRFANRDVQLSDTETNELDYVVGRGAPKDHSERLNINTNSFSASPALSPAIRDQSDRRTVNTNASPHSPALSAASSLSDRFGRIPLSSRDPVQQSENLYGDMPPLQTMQNGMDDDDDDEMPPLQTIGGSRGMPPLQTIGGSRGMPPLQTIGGSRGMPPLQTISGSRGDRGKQDIGYNDMPPLEPNAYTDMPPLEPSYDDMPPLESTVKSEYSGDGDTQIMLGNFPYGTRENELFRLLKPYGARQILVNNSSMTNRSTTAVAYLESKQAAQQAVIDLDQTLFRGRKLMVFLPYNIDLVPQMDMQQLTLKVDSTGRNVKLGGTSERQKLSPMPALVPISPESSPPKLQANNGMWESIMKVYKIIVPKLRSSIHDFIYAEGSFIVVMITSVFDNEHFWAQVLTDKRGVRTDLKNLERVTKDLQMEVTRVNETRGLGRCAAKFEGMWYRAWIMSVRENTDKVDVFYVDYGNSACVDRNDTAATSSQVWNHGPCAKPYRLMDPWPKLKSLEDKMVKLQVVVSANGDTYVTTVRIVDMMST